MCFQISSSAIFGQDSFLVKKIVRRFLAASVCLSLLFTTCSCLDQEPEAQIKPADYGLYGREIAKELAGKWPNRSHSSSQEKSAARFIAEAFEELGYDAEIEPFTYQDVDGQVFSSQNIVVKIEGSGFDVKSEDGTVERITPQVIVGAHYDVSVTLEQAEQARLELEQQTSETTTQQQTTTETTNDETGTTTTTGEPLYTEVELPIPTLAEYDGIHNNAAGIGTLLTVASALKDQQTGYDVVLVAFGASSFDQAGARAFAAAMSKTDIARTDAMYNIDGIYAGDKVYAHSGYNSVRSGSGKSYEKRRKLYEATDIFYEYELYTNNRFALYTNQSAIDVPWLNGEPVLAEQSQETEETTSETTAETTENVEVAEPVVNYAVYREWTIRQSDHRPFDKLGIPIIFFESFDYDIDKIEDMKESSNPAFAATGGFISGTAFDSTDYLQSLFDLNTVSSASGSAKEDILTKRINNVAFVIEKAILKGRYDAVVE